MESLTSVRMYIGGLPLGITTKELYERFGKCLRNAKDCQLTQVELPKAKTPGKSVVSSENCRGFAYITLQGADAVTESEVLQRTYNRTKWRGKILKVQVAKPSFKLKLEQEREERELERKAREWKRQEQLKQIATCCEKVKPMKLKIMYRGRKTTTFIDVDEVEDGVEVKGGTDVDAVENEVKYLESEDDETSGSEDDETSGSEDDIEMFVRKMEEQAAVMKQDKEKKVLSKEEVNARRLAALEAKKKRMKVEKLVIPAIGETVGNKKITFDDSDDEQEQEEHVEDKDTKVVTNWMTSSDDEADIDATECGARETVDFTDSDHAIAPDAETQAAFALRPEFVGEKGKKLFEMQKRFGGDSRFHLDARFLEDDANEYGGNDMEDEEQQVDEVAIAELQNFFEEENLQETACHAREMQEEEEAALRVVSNLFPDVDVTRLQRRMQEQRAPKDPLKEAAWMGELKRYDPRDTRSCHEFEISMAIAASGAKENREGTAVPKREEKEIVTGGDRFFSAADNLSNLFSRVRKNSEDGEEGEAALDGILGIGTATTQTGSDAPFKLSSLFSSSIGEDKPLAAMGEQLLEDEQEDTVSRAGDWVFSQTAYPTDVMVDEVMATDSEAGDEAEDDEQTKAVLTKARGRKSFEDFLAFGRTFVGGRDDVANWPELRKRLTLDYKRKRRDAVKMKKCQNKQQHKGSKTNTDATATGTTTLLRWKKKTRF